MDSIWNLKKRILSFLFTIGVFLPFSSCQNEARWYPEADVTIANHYEYTDSITNAKQLFITCVIHNTGSTSIISGAVTLRVKTDKRKYLQTITVNIKIIPDGKIAVNTAIAYLDNTETLLSDGDISIFSSYFD